MSPIDEDIEMLLGDKNSVELIFYVILGVIVLLPIIMILLFGFHINDKIKALDLRIKAYAFVFVSSRHI